MQWLERWVLFITRHPGWIMAGGLVLAALALQMDGVLWAALGPGHTGAGFLAAVNGGAGIAGIVMAGFAGHGLWFRVRYRTHVEAAQQAPLPERPWEEGPWYEAAGAKYVQSVGRSAGLLGATVFALLFSTPIVEVGVIVIVACLVVMAASIVLRGWLRVTLKPPGAASRP